MAHIGTKGYYVAELKKRGIKKHPTEQKKLESYKTHVLRNLFENVTKNEAAQ